jgi:uncharacterized repeat protein (TIGR03803 family)
MKKLLFILITVLSFSFSTICNAQYNVILNFDSANGSNPCGSLVFSPAKDTLYGMTWAGGSLDAGALFSINSNGNNYHEISSFGDSNNHQVGAG